MTPPHPLSLRTLPVPAKLVLTAFLIAVGLGYLSAMVQLHLKHSDKSGEVLPTPADVVERFSGLKRYDPNEPAPRSKIELLLAGNANEPDVVADNMAPAFKAKSKGFAAECAARGRAAVEAERDGEREAFLLWTRADAQLQKQSYDADAFPLPASFGGRPVTAAFVAANAVKIKSMVEQRCQNCHKEQAPDLGDFTALAPLITPPSREVVDGKWVRSSKQMTVEHLTQSTHAHLLSFAVLFTVTGLTFAFSSWPAWIRGIVGPVVLIAQVADIACWWLARLPGVGPYFAMSIIGTGAVVGLGLVVQILGSLWSLYGPKGRGVLALLFLVGVGGIGVVMMKVIEPALKAERLAAAEAKAAALAPPVVKPAPPANVDPDVPKTARPSGPVVEAPPMSHMENLLVPKRDAGLKFNGKGSMVAAFFEKDGEDYKDLVEERGEAVVAAEREGERAAVLTWIRMDDAARRKAYDADLLPLPKELAGKPITADYLSDDKAAVKVRAILAKRCARCHAADSDQSDYPLETYEQIAKYLGAGGEPKPVAAK